MVPSDDLDGDLEEAGSAGRRAPPGPDRPGERGQAILREGARLVVGGAVWPGAAVTGDWDGRGGQPAAWHPPYAGAVWPTGSNRARAGASLAAFDVMGSCDGTFAWSGEGRVVLGAYTGEGGPS